MCSKSRHVSFEKRNRCGGCVYFCLFVICCVWVGFCVVFGDLFVLFLFVCLFLFVFVLFFCGVFCVGVVWFFLFGFFVRVCVSVCFYTSKFRISCNSTFLQILTSLFRNAYFFHGILQLD